MGPRGGPHPTVSSMKKGASEDEILMEVAEKMKAEDAALLEFQSRLGGSARQRKLTLAADREHIVRSFVADAKKAGKR